MSSTSSSLLSYLRVMAAAWRNDPRNDAELLVRFAEFRDEAAFAALAYRHGPLVWGTCLRILGNTQDAEDAFQATFLALARKASRVTIESLAGWLHRVARQTAMDVRSKSRRIKDLEQRFQSVPQQKLEESASRTEVYTALDEELGGLPERLRVPLVLRYLEGKTLEDVARIVGCSRPAVSKRLVRGEVILRQRLERRGLAIGVVSVAAFLGNTVPVSAVPARLIGNTARAAVAFHSGTFTSGVAEAMRAASRSLPFPLESSQSAALAEGVMETMGTTKMKLLAALLGMTLCLATGGMLAYQVLAGHAAESPQAGGEIRGEAESSGQPGATARVDCFGDPLPAHALARMGTVRLWRRQAWQYSDKNAFAFSPDGKTLATPIDRTTVCLWDAATGKEIHRLTTKAVQESIASLGFSPDGKTLVTIDDNQMVCRWEVATGKFLRKQQYQGPKRDNVQSLKVAFLPDGRMLGYGNFLKSVEQGRGVRGAYVWDIATGKEICQLSRPMNEGEGWNESTVFSPDGKILTTSVNVDNMEKKTFLFLWDVSTGKEIRQLTYKDGYIHAVAFSRDGKTLASAADDEKICVWEVATGKKIRRLRVEGAHDGPLTYSPDGKTLVGGEEGHLWNVGTGKEIRSFGWKKTEVALFSPDGKVLAVGDQAGSIRLWEVATGKEIGPRKGYQGGIQSVAYSPDGKTLVWGGRDGTVRQWEVATGKEIRQLTTEMTQEINSVAYSPDGKLLVSVDCALHLWNTATGKEIRKFGEGGGPKSAVFSSDGKILAAIMSNDQMVCLWEVATGKEIYSRPIASSSVSLAFSPDDRLLASPGENDTVSLWEAATGRLIGQLGGLEQPAQQNADKFVIRSLTFSAGGRMLATCGRGGREGEKIHVWEVANGKKICQLEGLKNCQEDCTIALSPDGKILAIAAQRANPTDGSIDPTVHLWEMASGKEISRLAGHQAPVQSITFSPDGKTLASGSTDLTCLIWDLTSVSRLKPALARPLTKRVLSKEQLEAAWTDLANDPPKAYGAIWALQAVPMQAIALLQARVRPVTPLINPGQLQHWIADLDDSSFAVREKAQREIVKLGEPAIPALRQALKVRPALEVRRRLQALLAELEPKGVLVSPRGLREFRAVQVLEYIGTAEARQILQTLAKGVPQASLTREAQAALTRLSKRSADKP